MLNLVKGKIFGYSPESKSVALNSYFPFTSIMLPCSSMRYPF